MKGMPRLLPRTLVGRVFALYSVSLLCFVGSGAALLFRYQFMLALETAQQRAESLVQVVSPTIVDNAIIGDYDSIRRTLERAIHRSDFASASFIDASGGVLEVTHPDPLDVAAPAQLRALVAERLFDSTLPIGVGGKDYGVLRMHFSADRIAGELWAQTRYAFLLALAALAGGLVLLRAPLRYWLGDFARMTSFEESMRSGRPPAHESFGAHAPLELKQTFEVLTRAAASMQAQREHAEATLTAIGDGVLTIDSEGRIILANPAACRMLACDADALLGRDVRAVLPQMFDSSTGLEHWSDKRSRLAASDGRELVVDSSFSAIPGPPGEPQDHVLAMHDITARHALDERLRAERRVRKQALTALRGLLENLMRGSDGTHVPARADDITAVSQLIDELVRRLQQRGEQLSAIFELSPDGFVSFDDRHAVSYVSPAFVRLTGLDEKRVLGLHEADFGRLLGAQCTSGGALLHDFGALRQSEREMPPGRRRDLVELARPAKRTLEVGLRVSRSAGTSQLLHLRDVTHETEVEQIKGEFLSTAAHELRTPMSSIFGFSELMMTGRLSPERQRAATETIHRQTQLMISIVNEMLDLARIEARRGKDFALDEVDLRELTQQVLHDFKPPGGRRDPSLAMPDAAVAVRVDRGKMAQALGNVLSNAYKYSPGGGEVGVRIVLRDGEAHGPQAGVQVQDHGIGMTADQLARVCERFYRADDSGSIPGTGLGMSIVKEIVELLGGSLALTSEPGHGTVATLWLPLAAQAVPEAVVG